MGAILQGGDLTLWESCRVLIAFADIRLDTTIVPMEESAVTSVKAAKIGVLGFYARGGHILHGNVYHSSWRIVIFICVTYL